MSLIYRKLTISYLWIDSLRIILAGSPWYTKLKVGVADLQYPIRLEVDEVDDVDEEEKDAAVKLR